MGEYHTHMATDAPLDWSTIDTVLLDMDGTLLDLRFDNWFWQELVPNRYAIANGISLMDACELLKPKFTAARGTLQWYCVEHWTRELGLDIAEIKRHAFDRIAYLPGAERFLLKLRQSGKRRVLVTNAHPKALAIKDERVGLSAYFDECYSTHAFEVPKEDPRFWPRLNATERFASDRTLFVDDSLAVLHAAEAFGIRWLRAIRCPDSGRPPQDTGHYVAVDGIGDIG